MGAGKVPSGRDPPVRAEVVRESERTRVTRLFLAGRTVIRKEPLGADAAVRLRHEAAVLERLRGVAGVAQLVDGPQDPGALVLADAGGPSLARLGNPLAAGELTGLAAGLARAVAGMHRRGVMHRDITPVNIVVSGDGVPCLVDFALAAPIAEIRPEFTHHAGIAGTLAYLAPEATGRTGRPADQRADLYALGAVLYELATGAPPFGSGDLLRLTHDLLARMPAPPDQVNPAIPVPLSQVIMHLLEKDPDHRYQSADGVAFDLKRLRDFGAAAGLRVGERDVPLRLVPPSRLAGREDEVAALEAAFDGALAGRCRGVLIGGAPGVGKTALADQLRPVVTGADGWFVAGKFDAYRRDLEFDAVYQASRALGRLLLAEPEEELARARTRILAAAGANAGLLTATVPEFAALLGVPPDPGDPLTAQVRMQRVGATVLRAVASRKRPVVVFTDDLQWGGRTPLGFVDLVLREGQIDGLLLVGAYREDDVDATHPLGSLLSRWQDEPGVQHLRLGSLPGPDLADMVAEMLHVDPATAADLAGVIGPHTSGNPYETVELLNTLRRDGVLTASAAGWRWDAAAVRACLGKSEVAGLLAARAGSLPEQSRQLLEAMACLGGRAEVSMLQAATGAPAGVVEQRLAPPLTEGLLVAELGAHEAVRFRHDRIRESLLGGLDPERRRALQLAMARRLAAVPELFAAAAEQYLPAVDAVGDATERRRVAGLLRRAADQATLIGDYALVDALLAAALRLIDPGEIAALAAVRTGHLAALYGLGRLEEGDEEYQTIRRLGATALQRAEATAVQVLSLTHRTRFTEAADLGLESLRELGITAPAAEQLSAELGQHFGHLQRWLDQTEGTDYLARPEITDPALLGIVRLIYAVQPSIVFADNFAMVAWLSLEGLRIWLEHGPCPTLLGPASAAAFVPLALRGDYAAGYRILQRLLALSEARGYNPGVTRFIFSAFCCWFEPIENSVQAGRRAREELLAAGDLANVGYGYQTVVAALLDCSLSLDACVAEMQAGLAFASRTGNEEASRWLDSCRWLTDVLRGESASVAGEAVPLDRYAGSPLVLSFAHLTRAIAAAIFGDLADLERHVGAAIPLNTQTTYATALARLLRVLALAGQVRATDGSDRGGLLAEMDEETRWLAERAANAPDNFLHLLRLAEAERAWAAGDFRAAALAFDAARREAAGRRRPWHRALITERAARFHLARGLEHAGYELLALARQEYLAWGATAKAAQLDWAYPALHPHAAATHGADQPGDLAYSRDAVTAGTIDMLGILSASQALSSETSIGRLHARVTRVLGAITGATGVHLALWSEDRQDWLLPAPSGGTVPVSGTGRETAVPQSVLRYVQRTREPLVAGDPPRDDRFARDPYFADLPCCSLLAVPILSRGDLRAVLLLENRLLRGAFTADRLEAVRLIAGQLAVSLDNAQLYAELTASRARIVAAGDHARRRIERDLHDGAQQRLVALVLQLRAVQAAVPPELGTQLDRAVAEAAGAQEELRELAHGIHPAILARGGLGAALKALARRCPVPVGLRVDVDDRLPEPVEVSAYYVVAEALTNTAKHARAPAVSVEAEADDGILRVTVRDDGVGGAGFTGGTGLAGLKDRVEALGGRIFLDSPAGAGTSLRAEFPFTAR